MPPPSETPTRWPSCRPSPVDEMAMIAPEWLDPETPPWTGPDAGLPTLYEYVESAGPFVGRPTTVSPPAAVLAPVPPPSPAAPPRAMAALAVAEPEPEPEREPSVLQQLALVPDVQGPHARMALAWAV